MVKRVVAATGLVLLAAAWLASDDVLRRAAELQAFMYFHETAFLNISGLILGTLVFAFVMLLEWNVAFNHVRIQHVSLATIEHKHLRLPYGPEMVATMVLTIIVLLALWATVGMATPVKLGWKVQYIAQGLPPDLPSGETGGSGMSDTGSAPDSGGASAGTVDDEAAGDTQHGLLWWIRCNAARFCGKQAASGTPPVLESIGGKVTDAINGTGVGSIPLELSLTEGPTTTVVASIKTNAYGAFSFGELPVTNKRSSYAIRIQVSKNEMDSFKVVGATEQSGLPLFDEKPINIEFAVKPQDSFAYAPCLSFAKGVSEKALTDAEYVLSQLYDSTGKALYKKTDEKLVTREAFRSLLLRTLCVPEKTVTAKDIFLGRNATEPIARSEAIEWIDRALNLTPDDWLQTLTQIFAKSDSPTVHAAAGDMATLLPEDVSKDSTSALAYATLRARHILPGSFVKSLAESKGITPKEMALLVARAGFSKGTIPLLQQNKKEAAPEFVKDLPDGTLPSCISIDAKRSRDFLFSDVTPDHPLYAKVSLLLSLATLREDDAKPLWVLAGTNGLAEHGVGEGTQTLQLDEEVSLAELLRTLEAFTCAPWPQENSAITNFLGQVVGMVAGQKDAIAGLKQDRSRVARIFWSAQKSDVSGNAMIRFTKVFDGPDRNPQDSVSLSEASSIIASALLFSDVQEKRLTLEEAEGRMQALEVHILEYLTKQDVTWRNLLVGTRDMLRMHQLIDVLGWVAQNRFSEPLPSGGYAWQRRLEAKGHERISF